MKWSSCHTHTHHTKRERENRYCLMQVRAICLSSNLAICKGASTSKVFMPQKVAATISVCQSCQLRATRTVISSASDERRICRRLPLWVLATKASPKEQCQRHKPRQAPLCACVCLCVCALKCNCICKRRNWALRISFEPCESKRKHTVSVAVSVSVYLPFLSYFPLCLPLCACVRNFREFYIVACGTSAKFN